jgi:AcrR family transcriptional regulator
LKLFVHEGFSAINIRAIAAEAGYSNPALFKYFKTKEELGLFLFSRCYLRYAEVFTATIVRERSFKKNLEALLDAFFKAVHESPEAFLFMQDHLRQFWPQASSQVRSKSILRQVRQLIEQGQREGAVGPELSPKILVAAFVGFLTQFVRMLYFKEFSDAAVWQREVATVVKRILLR